MRKTRKCYDNFKLSMVRFKNKFKRCFKTNRMRSFTAYTERSNTVNILASTQLSIQSEY